MLKSKDINAHRNALMRDYAQQLNDLHAPQLERLARVHFWQNVAGGFMLTALGLFIGYLITAAF